MSRKVTANSTPLRPIAQKPLAGGKQPARQRGFNLVEVMISLLVLALGLAGIAALLLQGMATSNAASLNSIAVAQAQTGAEMMRANLEAYTAGWYEGANTSGAPSSVICAGTCNEAEQAANDFDTWRTQLAATMPDGQAFICTDSTPDDGQPGALACDGTGTNVIKIFWRDIKDPDLRQAIEDGGALDDLQFQRYVTSVSP